MKEKINQILINAKKEIASVVALKDIEILGTKYLGRKSELNEVLKSIGSLSLEEKKTVGAEANRARKEIESLIISKENMLASMKKTEAIDITAPGRQYEVGHIHPVIRVMNEIMEVFKALGYEIVEGNEVEDDYHNFEALNMPPDHPAKIK